MPTEILMPALSPTMTEGNLARWLKQEGDAIAPGDVIAEIETDKATMEVEAVDEGKLGKILVAEGTEGVKVNTPIAVIVADGEDADAVAAQPAVEASSEPAPQPAEPARATVSARPATDDSIVATAAETEVPEGTKMTTVTMREALRDAMAEEMRADDKVFIMGEIGRAHV